MTRPVFIQASHPDFSLIEGTIHPADPETGLPERVASLTAYSKHPPFEAVSLTNEQFLECEAALIEEFHQDD